MEDDRFQAKQILTVAQWCLGTVISGGGLSDYRAVFGPNPVDLYGWEDKDEYLTFAQEA